MTNKKLQKRKSVLRAIRHRRVRAKISGTKEMPRLSVFRSAKHINTQLIDDENGKTLVSASDFDINKKEIKGKIEVAIAVGKALGEKAKEKGIKSVKFDRSGYAYQGRVEGVAKGAREAGLEF